VETTRPDWLTDDSDTTKPSIARMYDYFLGGSRHLEIDRAVAAKAVEAAPGIKILIWENRKFLKRVGRWAASRGIQQFLDLGSGIPAGGNLHTVVQQLNPSARVVYVDIDPVAVARATELLADDPYAAALQGDVTEPAAILASAPVRELIDFDRPVAVLLLNVLHFVPYAAVEPAVAAFREVLSPGSALAITHGTGDLASTDPTGISKVYAEAFGHMTMRDESAFGTLFGDFELIEPGIVDVPQWRPDSGLAARMGPVNCYAGVAVRP
jgi:hypothetical protein